MLRVKNLYLRYTREFYALYNINMEIADNERVAFVGEVREMASLGNHAGFVGYGEHYNNRFVNQSMTCVVFE